MIEKNLPITSSPIKEIISRAAERRRMFLKVFEDHNKEMEVLVQKKEYSSATYERFTTAKAIALVKSE